MQQLTAGITKATTGIDGIVWNILGQTYYPKAVCATRDECWQKAYALTEAQKSKQPGGLSDRFSAMPIGQDAHAVLARWLEAFRGHSAPPSRRHSAGPLSRPARRHC